MFKRLLVLLIVGAAGFTAWHAAHPAPVAAGDEALAAAPDDSFAGRLKLRMGEMGANVLGNQIRASIAKTEHELAVLKPVIKRTSGSSQRRALAVSKKVVTLDSLAIANLDASHPIAAIKLAMSARGFIDLIKQDVAEERAAR